MLRKLIQNLPLREKKMTGRTSTVSTKPASGHLIP